MSLARRLKSAQPNSGNHGCRTCLWWLEIRPESRKSINEWISAGHSLMQLHEILSAPSDDPNEPALPVSLTGWRHHMKHHAERCRL
jgi:hypothetical protein